MHSPIMTSIETAQNAPYPYSIFSPKLIATSRRVNISEFLQTTRREATESYFFFAVFLAGLAFTGLNVTVSTLLLV